MIKKVLIVSILLLLNTSSNSISLDKSNFELSYKSVSKKVFKFGKIDKFKLNRNFGFKNSVTDSQLDSIINYCNDNCRFNPNIVITTIYRESCFNPNIKNLTGGPDLGLGQFVPIAIKYHNLDVDSITNYMYATKAIVLRYHDIIDKLHPKSDKLLIAAYGDYNRVRINDTIAINKSYKLFIKKQKELNSYIIK